IVHSECYAITFEIIYFMLDGVAIFAFKLNCKLAFAFYYEICSAVLIAECVTAYAYRCCPVRHQARDIVDDDWLTEYGAIQDIADSAIRAFPHLFQFELFHT